MKIFNTALFAVAALSMVACNQNNSTQENMEGEEVNLSMNDSIAFSDNGPQTRDLSTAKGQNLDMEESALKFTETPSQMKLVLPNADVFEEGSANFKAGAEATLEETYQMINNQGVGKVLITGNTGREGDPDENYRLSTDRAMAIAKWLKGKDLKKEVSLSAQGGGDRFPMVSYELSSGEPNDQANELNSRTEITFRKSRTTGQ